MHNSHIKVLNLNEYRYSISSPVHVAYAGSCAALNPDQVLAVAMSAGGAAAAGGEKKKLSKQLRELQRREQYWDSQHLDDDEREPIERERKRKRVLLQAERERKRKREQRVVALEVALEKADEQVAKVEHTLQELKDVMSCGWEAAAEERMAKVEHALQELKDGLVSAAAAASLDGRPVRM